MPPMTLTVRPAGFPNRFVAQKGGRSRRASDVDSPRQGARHARRTVAGGAGMFGVEWFGSLATDLVASALFLGGGFVVGRYRERQRLKGHALHEYDFYPYGATPENFAEFSLKDFRLAMHHFLRNSDPRAARQLIFIGEQNNVKDLLNGSDLRTYEHLVAKYHGVAIADDAREFLDNYRNIARLIGRTFP